MYNESLLATHKEKHLSESICQRVETEHTRLKIEFLKTSLRLINQALETSDEENLRQIHQAWSLALENVMRQCENLIGPIKEVLQILSDNNPEIETKYSGVLASTVLSSSLAGLAIGATIIYRHPDYFLRVAQANMPGLDRLLAIVCTTTYVIGKITSTNFHAVYRNWRDYVRSIMVKYLPNYIDSSITDTSETDIVTVIKSSIYKIDIYENVWHKPEELNMIKESIQSQLEHLEKLKQGRSPQEDYFHFSMTVSLNMKENLENIDFINTFDNNNEITTVTDTTYLYQ
ncbi:unnamed protein product [Rotaria magnacalcarata]|uniref:Uncharacterized protein n=1 Tax=Rotaria magnacalcarata TaxID=392030 RepID=A0A820DUM0_9BILA|nr:unnamed protein product [Rotaria magnacalcarata]CAF4237948.1 unnamed protein product [Rotaria magnacalcarata]